MPREYMCPSCARLVQRCDRACDGCGADLRRTKPVETADSKPDPWWMLLLRPWMVGLLATTALLVFATSAIGSPKLAHAFLMTAIAVPTGGLALVKLAKLRDGFEEFLCYLFRRPLMAWLSDDPLDDWLLVVIIVSVLVWLMLGGIVAPSVGNALFWNSSGL